MRKALARERLEFKGESLELPLPDGPGKALKLTIAPVQERIPIYLAAIGPKNTTLAAEIADGWIPTLFSPEHVGEFRPLLEEGFAAAGDGKGFDDFDIAPSVNVFVSDDRDSARDAMRHYIALYVGGMGSRKQNFYNALVQRYGFEDAAREVQDLYLEGKKDEAAAALPGELIDTVTLCGPADVVRERIGDLPRRRRRDPDDRPDGVDVRGPHGAAAPRGRTRVLKVFLGAFGDAGHAFPMLALGTALVARGHEVHFETWKRWRAARRGGGDPLRRRAGVPGLPHPVDQAPQALRRGGQGRARDRRDGGQDRAGRGGRGHHDPGGGAGRGVAPACPWRRWCRTSTRTWRPASRSTRSARGCRARGSARACGPA